MVRKKNEPARIARSGRGEGEARAEAVGGGSLVVERSPPPPPPPPPLPPRSEGKRRGRAAGTKAEADDEEDHRLLFGSSVPQQARVQEEEEEEEEPLRIAPTQEGNQASTTITSSSSPPPPSLSSSSAVYASPTSSAASSPAVNARQRPRFHTVQDLDLALHQAIEGKINIKNAWESKEASKLLEGISHTIEQTLAAHQSDDYGGFAKVATVVEGCSKVWTSRVDSTYRRSNQMVQRLLRNDEKKGRDALQDNDDVDDEENENENAELQDGENDNENDPLSAAARRRRQQLLLQQQQQQRKRLAAARTVALDTTEINLDAKSKNALTQSGINAQFRAITEKFDQSNANGLLLTNAPLGRAGNLILDVDYTAPSEQKKEFSIRRARREQRMAEECAAAAADLAEEEAFRRRASPSLRRRGDGDEGHGHDNNNNDDDGEAEEQALLSLNTAPTASQEEEERAAQEALDPLGALARGMRRSTTVTADSRASGRGSGHGVGSGTIPPQRSEEEEEEQQQQQTAASSVNHVTTTSSRSSREHHAVVGRGGNEALEEEELEEAGALLRYRAAMVQGHTTPSTVEIHAAGSAPPPSASSSAASPLPAPLPPTWGQTLLRSLGLHVSSTLVATGHRNSRHTNSTRLSRLSLSPNENENDNEEQEDHALQRHWVLLHGQPQEEEEKGERERGEEEERPRKSAAANENFMTVDDKAGPSLRGHAGETAALLLMDHQTIMHGAAATAGLYPAYLRGLATTANARHTQHLPLSTRPSRLTTDGEGQRQSAASVLGGVVMADGRDNYEDDNDNYNDFNNYEDDADITMGGGEAELNGAELAAVGQPSHDARHSSHAVYHGEQQEQQEEEQQQYQKHVMDEAKRLVSGIDDVPLDENDGGVEPIGGNRLLEMVGGGVSEGFEGDEEEEERGRGDDAMDLSNRHREGLYSLRSTRNGGAELDGLALGMEDPTKDWCLLQDLTHRQDFGPGSQRSELAKLHRAHKFLGTTEVKTEAAGEEDEKTIGGENRMAASGLPLAPQASPLAFPAAAESVLAGTKKRSGGGGGKKTVTFDLPSITSQLESMTAAASASASSPLSSSSPASLGSPISSSSVSSSSSLNLLALATQPASIAASALKQSPTLRKNLTPLGKELLLDKNAAANTLAYTQTAFQRAKAAEHKLVRPPPLAHSSATVVPDPVTSDRGSSTPMTTATPTNNNNNNTTANSSSSFTYLPSYLPVPPVSIHAFFQPFTTSNPQWNVLRKSSIHHGMDNHPSDVGGGLAGTTAAGGAGSMAERGSRSSSMIMPEDDTEDYGPLPTERIPVGADLLLLPPHARMSAGEAVAGFDGTLMDDGTGSHYYDGGYGDLDDNDGAVMQDDEEEDAELERRQAELNLLAQLQANAAAAAAGGAGGRFQQDDDSQMGFSGTGRSSWDMLWDRMERGDGAEKTGEEGDGAESPSGAEHGEDDAAALVVQREMEWMRALRAAQPTLLQSVDVSKLRQIMWQAIKEVTQWDDETTEEEEEEEENQQPRGQQGQATPSGKNSHQHLSSTATTASRKRQRGGGEEGEEEETLPPTPATATSLLKASARKLYASVHASTTTTTIPGSSIQSLPPGEASAAHQRRDGHDEEEEEEEEEEANRSEKKNEEEEDLRHLRLPYLSHVVARLLPHVQQISPSGVLSPAFLFFSLLFIANERNVLLENEELEKFADLRILRIAPRVGERGEGRGEGRGDVHGKKRLEEESSSHTKKRVVKRRRVV